LLAQGKHWLCYQATNIYHLLTPVAPLPGAVPAPGLS
jgi:hypothetical protein